MKLKIAILVTMLFFITGCQVYNLNKMSLEQVVDFAINQDFDLYNVNNKGYRYYLPKEFIVVDDYDYNQVLLSNGNEYYLNIDIVRYHYKNELDYVPNGNVYKFYSFNKENKKGYLEIRKNNDYFFIELCYNYAIIEVQVKENDIDFAVSRSIYILSSVQYNDAVIDKIIGENILQSSENKYELKKPEIEGNDNKYLEFPDDYYNEEE